MSKRILFLGCFVLLAALFTVQSSYASHFLGGQLTYQVVPGVPNRYKLVLSVFGDCGGANLYSTMTFDFKSDGCNTAPGDPASITTALIQSGISLGAPYCTGIWAPPGANQCVAGAPANYQIGRYEVEVTLPPKAEWRISVNDSSRPATANLVGQDLMQYEATLRNLGAGGQNLVNNAAQFATEPVQFIGVRAPTLLSALAYDADGDSLVYSLEQPLSRCNNPIPYLPFTGPPIYIDLTPTSGPPCFASLPAGLTYSRNFPLPSFTFTGTCPVKTAVPTFGFNVATGSMAFTPYMYIGGPNTTANKYVVSIKVAEYRRINNAYTLVGTTRRDQLLIIADWQGNQNPDLTLMRINNSSGSVPVSTVIPAVAGQLVSVQLTGADADAGQLVTLSSNAGQMLPAANFVASTAGTQPTATLSWLPPASLPTGRYYCNVTLTDNACPYKGVTQQTLVFNVTNTTLATKSAQNVATLAAVPTPFWSKVSFRLTQPGVQTVMIFDQLGRQVTEVRSLPSGEVVWQPSAQVPAGLYFARSSDGRQVARLLRTGTE